MITANQAIVTLQEITQETLRPILQLEVRKDQTHSEIVMRLGLEGDV